MKGSRDTETWSHSPECIKCGRPGAVIQITRTEAAGDRFLLIYRGPGGSNGSGSGISREDADRIKSAFTRPYDSGRIRSAGFYDDAGYCHECRAFYCETHWNISSTGGGRCPEGHFKSLDPHWSPD